MTVGEIVGIVYLGLIAVFLLLCAWIGIKRLWRRAVEKLTDLILGF